LPPLNDSLQELYLRGNPISEIVGNGNNLTKINKFTHFREFYFLSKLRKKFISWMWKSREERIKEQFHPDILYSAINTFNDSEDSNELDNWIKNNWDF
jgi:CO dehydrogenase/acetyl-CoA synthase beta subunit